MISYLEAALVGQVRLWLDDAHPDEDLLQVLLGQQGLDHVRAVQAVDAVGPDKIKSIETCPQMKIHWFVSPEHSLLRLKGLWVVVLLEEVAKVAEVVLTPGDQLLQAK